MNNNKTQRFTTEDLHLAAYLMCSNDVKLEKVERTDHEETLQFVFTGNDERIDELLLLFYNRKGKVEPQRYNEETGRLRDLIKLELSRATVKITKEDCKE